MGSAILTYHSLDNSGSVVSIRPEVFKAHIESLLERGIPIVSLEKALHTPRGVALTFDDGYESFAELALPLLIEYKIPATVFVVSGRCGQANSWDSSGRVPRFRLMSWEALCSLPSEVVSLGAHSVSHADMTRLSIEAARIELRDSRAEIEQRTGREVASFAYPYGGVTKSIRNAAAAEYRIAVGTRLSHLANDSDLLNLPRIDTYYLKEPRRFREYTAGDGVGRLAIRRWLRRLRGAALR